MSNYKVLSLSSLIGNRNELTKLRITPILNRNGIYKLGMASWFEENGKAFLLKPRNYFCILAKAQYIPSSYDERLLDNATDNHPDLESITLQKNLDDLFGLNKRLQQYKKRKQQCLH